MITVIMGPSGSGKSTLGARLIRAKPYIQYLPSYTTRPKRLSDELHPGELTNISEEEFLARRDKGEFMWTIQPYGGKHYYGTRVEDIDTALAGGVHVAILTGDAPAALYGYATAKRMRQNLLFFYLMVTNPGILRDRLAEDRSRSEEDLSARIAAAVFENESVNTSVVPRYTINAHQSKDDVLFWALSYINKHPSLR